MLTIARLTGVATLAAILALTLAARPAAADAGGGSTTAPSSDPNYLAGLKAAQAGRCQAAIGDLQKALAADPKSADALNMLGFCNRKLGNFPASLDYYNRALAIDPRHRGAHEYLGELYLQMNDLAKAQGELKTLDGLCTFGCDEYDDLKQAIAAYQAGGPKKSSATGGY